MEDDPTRSDGSRRRGSYQMGDVGDGAIVQQGEHNILNVGANAAEVAVVVTEAYQRGLDQNAAELRQLSETLNIAESAIAGFFKTMHEAQVPLEQAAAKFEELALSYQHLLESVRTLQSDDPEVQGLKVEAAAAIKAGPSSYDRAEELLRRAETIDREAAERLAVALEKRSLNAAATRAQRGELSLLRLDYESAIEHFKEAIEMTPPSHPEVRVQHRKAYAGTLYAYGKDRGINHALEEVIDVYKSLTRELPRERVPLDWAMTQNNLGNALWRLGEREAGTAHLQEAVAAYRNALREYTRERVPLQWEMTQNNFEIALRTLEKRRKRTVLSKCWLGFGAYWNRIVGYLRK